MENKKMEIVEQDYFNENDIVIKKTKTVTAEPKEEETTITYGQLKQKLADLQQARIDKISAIDAQIAEVEHDLELAQPEVAKVEIKEVPEVLVNEATEEVEEK